jgi:hypothetical protein
MPAMGVDDSVFRNLTNPKMKRQNGISQVAFQTTIGFYQNILNNVADTDSTHDLLIKSKLNHPTQGIAMFVQKFIDSPVLAVSYLIQQFDSFFVLGPNRLIHKGLGGLTVRSFVAKVSSIVVSRQ